MTRIYLILSCPAVQMVVTVFRGLFVVPGMELQRGTPYVVMIWLVAYWAGPLTNILFHLQLMGALYWSGRCSCVLKIASCSYLTMLFGLSAIVVAVELVFNIFSMAIWKFVDSKAMRNARALTLLCTDVAFIVLIALYGHNTRTMNALAHAAAVESSEHRKSLKAAEDAASYAFLFTSGACSSLLFLSKVMPWELILGFLASHSPWLQSQIEVRSR